MDCCVDKLFINSFLITFLLIYPFTFYYIRNLLYHISLHRLLPLRLSPAHYLPYILPSLFFPPSHPHFSCHSSSLSLSFSIEVIHAYALPCLTRQRGTLGWNTKSQHVSRMLRSVWYERWQLKRDHIRAKERERRSECFPTCLSMYLVSRTAEYGLPKGFGGSAHRHTQRSDSYRMAQKGTGILTAC